MQLLGTSAWRRPYSALAWSRAWELGWRSACPRPPRTRPLQQQPALTPRTQPAAATHYRACSALSCTWTSTWPRSFSSTAPTRSICCSFQSCLRRPASCLPPSSRVRGPRVPLRALQQPIAEAAEPYGQPSTGAEREPLAAAPGLASAAQPPLAPPYALASAAGDSLLFAAGAFAGALVAAVPHATLLPAPRHCPPSRSPLPREPCAPPPEFFHPPLSIRPALLPPQAWASWTRFSLKLNFCWYNLFISSTIHVFVASVCCPGMGQLDVWVLSAVFIVSAILGDAVNYAVGAWRGDTGTHDQRLGTAGMA